MLRISHRMSHPTWVRGLKLSDTSHLYHSGIVAPYMGAWIETKWFCGRFCNCTSHPTWVRGLKHNVVEATRYALVSHPTWVRGLKLLVVFTLNTLACVAPYMGAWIETLCFEQSRIACKSHPTWVRGLKRHEIYFFIYHFEVAPYMGAWIETVLERSGTLNITSHPTWVRGLKLTFYQFTKYLLGRTLHGCVD